MMLVGDKFEVVNFCVGGPVDLKELNKVGLASLAYKAPGVVFICAKIIKP